MSDRNVEEAIHLHVSRFQDSVRTYRHDRTMVLPRRIRPLTSSELHHLTVPRLLAYRKLALSLENSLAASDYTNTADSLDPTYIWFKDDPRWEPLYHAILDELQRKQHPQSA